MGEASTAPETSSSSGPEVLRVLEALKQASQDLQSHPSATQDDSSDSPVKVLLELETESDTILSTDPHLSALSHLLARLKSDVQTLREARGRRNLNSFFARRFSTQSISKLAGSIETEIQAWIDRESVERVARALHAFPVEAEQDEEKVVNLMALLENRVSDGFNRDLQDLLLKWRVFEGLETVLCDPRSGKRVKEQAAMAIAALIRFNKDVFVGEVLINGRSVEALLKMSSTCSMKVLSELIRRIKSPLIDEIESHSKLPKIISLLDSEDTDLKLAAMDCILEIGYFGRREAIDVVIKEGGLVEKLVQLQRSKLGGDLIEMENCDSDSDEGSEGGGVSVQDVYGSRRSRRERRYLERRPFASCVARFAVQLEVGEGLRQRERRSFKQEILLRVKEASLSDMGAECEESMEQVGVKENGQERVCQLGRRWAGEYAMTLAHMPPLM
uniref:Uncharacterized protein n=1 Tax=Kalanchoe fedtschenkoi TaxID=63787 RepID=A0A7N0U0W2_KALFE